MGNSGLSVLHVDHERGWAGGQTQVMGLICRLRERGHRVSLAAHPLGELGARARQAGIPIHALAIRHHFDPLAGARLRHLLLTTRCDIVHFHTSRAHSLALWLPRRKPRRVVTRRMDYRLRGGWPVRWLYNGAVDRVIAISQGVKRALVESGVSEGRIRVIPSGVDLNRFEVVASDRDFARRKLGLAERELLLLVPAVLEPRKGHGFLLRALSRMRGRLEAVRVICCGSGSLRAELEAMAARLGLGDRVRFIGFADNVPELLAACDAVVLPSLHEGMGVALLEAMACGKAVVASAVGGVPEVLGDGAAGILVPPADEEALAGALLRLIADGGLRERLGKAGRERAHARFSLDAMALATEACYGELAGGGE